MDTRLNKRGETPGWVYVIAFILGLLLVVIVGYIIGKSAGVQVDILGDIW